MFSLRRGTPRKSRYPNNLPPPRRLDRLRLVCRISRTRGCSVLSPRKSKDIERIQRRRQYGQFIGGVVHKRKSRATPPSHTIPTHPSQTSLRGKTTSPSTLYHTLYSFLSPTHTTPQPTHSNDLHRLHTNQHPTQPTKKRGQRKTHLGVQTLHDLAHLFERLDRRSVCVLGAGC